MPQLVLGKDPIPYDGKYIVAWAAEDKAVFIEKARAPLKKALEKGVTHLHGIDLKRASEEFATVNLYAVHNGASAIGAGAFSVRFGSVYITETKSVYINTSSLENGGEPTHGLLTHEFFGALGYDDTNYQLTSVLVANQVSDIAKSLQSFVTKSKKPAKTQTSPRAKLYLNQYDKTGLKNSKSTGGVTVIGGGGDEVLITAKAFMLDHFTVWQKNFLTIKDTPKLKEFLQSLTYLDLNQLDLKAPIFQEYLAHFVLLPFEPMTYQTGLTNSPIKSLEEVNAKAAGVFQNEHQDSYVRMSRDHWGQAINEMSLQQSQEFISLVLHSKLFADYLSTRYPR